jgi:hypothetical protein
MFSFVGTPAECGFYVKEWIISRRRVIMRKMKFGILLVFAVLALVSVASAGLPSQVTANIVTSGSQSYWDVDVTIGGGDISANNYIGWCSYAYTYLANGTDVPFNVYSSLGLLPANLPSANWNKINYVINHKGTADKFTIQRAIWHYAINGPIAWGTYDEAKYNALIAAADANPTYVPDVGEKYAVILWKSTSSQPVFIEVPIPTIPSPEFPTLALPVAMMIGLVGAVQYVRARKE